MYNKYVLLILISFNLSQTIFSQANSESSKNSELEKQKLQYELDELENRKEIIRDRILELEKSTDLKKETSLKNEEEFFKLEDSIVITASKREQKVTDAPSAIYVITDKQIRERGYRWLSDALKDTPGFDIQNMYGQFPTLFHQRGIVGNNQRTLFYIDGLPDMGISEQSVRSGNTEYPLHNVKRIEILAGPAAALHGSGAFSGTINIITKDGKGNPGNSIDVTYGTWESNFRNPSYMTNFSVRGSGKQDESFQYSVSGYYYKTQGPNFGQNQHLDKKNINPNNVDYALESNACGGTCKPDGNSVGYYWSPKYNMSGADTYNISGKLSVGGFRFQTINWQYLQGAGTFNNGTYVSDFKERGLETNNFDSRNNFRRVGLIYGISPAGSRGSEIHNRQNALSVGYLYKFNARTSIDSEVFARQTDVISSTFNENLKKVGPNSEYRPGGFNLATFLDRIILMG
ncbi:MAG: TonB-dependent receptor plug domain-containing protein [Leptospiraceae bacterium]|nr:TonB-dependent receptor plug domain-containing protein [Leptospiraceae bacterium]